LSVLKNDKKFERIKNNDSNYLDKRKTHLKEKMLELNKLEYSFLKYDYSTGRMLKNKSKENLNEKSLRPLKTPIHKIKLPLLNVTKTNKSILETNMNNNTRANANGNAISILDEFNCYDHSRNFSTRNIVFKIKKSNTKNSNNNSNYSNSSYSPILTTKNSHNKILCTEQSITNRSNNNSSSLRNSPNLSKLIINSKNNNLGNLKNLININETFILSENEEGVYKNNSKNSENIRKKDHYFIDKLLDDTDKKYKLVKQPKEFSLERYHTKIVLTK
jgi:hypothetical protein